MDRRVDFRWGYLEALMEVAHYWEGRKRYDHAVGLYQRAVKEDFSREDIHRKLLILLNSLGRRSEAAAHYQHMVNVLREAHKQPEPQTQQLYAEIMA
jgi:DNA-binding SARP family transcriptional activator